MVDFFNQKNKIKEFDDTLKMVADAFDLGSLKARVDDLTKEQHSDGFWDNMAHAGEVNRELKMLETKIQKFEKVRAEVEDVKVLIELAEEADDESEVESVNAEIAGLTDKIEHLRLDALLKGKYDSLNAIITLHAGAGGTEAQDWVQMLYRMYSRYIERKGYQMKVLDLLEGDEAGIKSVTFTAEGDNAYGYLKAEKGIHRLVRISPFDSQSRRHTSFASVEVMPEIINDEEIEIRPEDLKVDTYRSGGAGGQHVNKTESAIRIIHVPTGTVVDCQDERSQYKNKEKALKILRSRIYEKMQAEQNEKIASDRRSQVGTGDRSERIRTYNFPQGRVTDHRIGLTLYKILQIMDGDLDELIDALITTDRANKLAASEDNE